jgi:hypothetical protein
VPNSYLKNDPSVELSPALQSTARNLESGVEMTRLGNRAGFAVDELVSLGWSEC